MDCREFEELWDDLLDARQEALLHLERGLDAHASTCLRCRDASDRYQLLRQALASHRPPTPSAESVERLYALTVPSRPRAIPIRASRPRLRVPRPMAAAAFALAWLGCGGWPDRGPIERPPANFPASSVPRRPLGLALADATEATLDLARETSAPASRIGREMLGLGQGLSPSTTPESAPAEGLADLTGSADAPGLFKAVGERFGAGVRPISGSARHAFRFLLGPAAEPEPASTGKQDSL